MKKARVLHPILFSVFPILFLWAQNIDEMRLADLVLPLVITLVVTALVLSLASRAFGSIQTSGIVVSVLVLLFFSYGYVLNALVTGFGPYRGEMFQVAIGFGSLLVLALVIRQVQGLGDRVHRLTPILNVVAAALVLIQLITGGGSVLEGRSLSVRDTTEEVSQTAAVVRPDIIFILLDAYGRQDVLKDLYQLDNREFLEGLNQRGFQVAHDSRAPYIQTLLSMAAIFNLDYLDAFTDLDLSAKDRVVLSEIIWNSRAIRQLKQLGYSTAAFSSGYEMTEFRKADRYLQPRRSQGEFPRLLISMTPLRLIVPTGTWFDQQRSRIEYTLQTLPEMEGRENPLFVLAHVVAPHPPFVFGDDQDGQHGDVWYRMGDGSFRVNSDAVRSRYVHQYRQQLEAVNELAMASVDGLLARPVGERPVIVVASDHGPGSELDWDSMADSNLRERVGSLFAVYFPDASTEISLPDPMSPVNTFRLIFNRYFGADYLPLPSRSFFSTWNEPFRFTEIEDSKVGLTSRSPDP